MEKYGGFVNSLSKQGEENLIVIETTLREHFVN